MNLIALEISINTLDIVIGIVNFFALIVFIYLIGSYVQCIRYIKKRRKVVERLRELRKLVEKQYDFK